MVDDCPHLYKFKQTAGGTGLRLAPLAFLLLAGCGTEGVPGHDALVRQVERSRVGQSPDQWIEMQNFAGQWERTGLIFGYAESNGDHDECEKAIAGLKRVNFAREYRCVPAN